MEVVLAARMFPPNIHSVVFDDTLELKRKHGTSSDSN